MRVLYVDDSELTRLIAKKAIRKLGVDDVLEAEDGKVALRLFEEHTPDVVFSDWNMPEMDGLSLLKEVRRRNPRVPFVMVSTESSRRKVLQAISEGISDYLTKPFTPVRLEETFAKWVTAKS